MIVWILCDRFCASQLGARSKPFANLCCVVRVAKRAACELRLAWASFSGMERGIAAGCLANITASR